MLRNFGRYHGNFYFHNKVIKEVIKDKRNLKSFNFFISSQQLGNGEIISLVER